MTKREKADQAEWAEKLRNILSPGDTIDCILRHVSRSGMSRRIDLYARTSTGPMFLTGMAAAAMGERWDRDKGGIIVGGCGMDMGFHLVYNLAYTLWPNGHPCTGEKCPSNDHSNGDRDYSIHVLTDENGIPEDREPGPGEKSDGCKRHWHADGGYSLRHNWL